MKITNEMLLQAIKDSYYIHAEDSNGTDKLTCPFCLSRTPSIYCSSEQIGFSHDFPVAAHDHDCIILKLTSNGDLDRQWEGK